MNWMDLFKSMEEYVDLHIGPNRAGLLPTLFGLHLAVGTTCPPICLVQSAREEKLYWVKANKNEFKLSLEDSPDLEEAIMHMAKRLFQGDIVNYVISHTRSIAEGMGSPFGALILLKRLAPFIQGGMGRLVAAIQKVKPGASFWRNDHFRLSFNAIAAVLGYTSYTVGKTSDGNTPQEQTLVCIELPVTFLPFQRIGLWLKANLELSTDGKCSHSFANYKHNMESKTVEILMLESDWQALPRHTVGTFVLAANQLAVSDPCVFKEMATIKYKWRLMGITEQAQIIAPGESGRVAIGHATEGDDYYSLQLDIKNEASKMLLNPVLPSDERSNRLQLQIQCATWETPERIDIGFSTNIDIDRTHIEVSSKRGVIKTKVAKHLLYTAGLYLLPKYRLRPSTFTPATSTILKNYLFEPVKLISKMFRGIEIITKATGRTDKQTPFLELRNTVETIWANSVTNPKVRRYNFGEEKDGVFDIELYVNAAYVLNGVPLMHVAYLESAAIACLMKEKQLTTEELLEARGQRREGSRKSSQKHIPMNANALYLWRKLLRYNASQTEQSASVQQRIWVKDSFIELYFPRCAVSPEEYYASKFMQGTFPRQPLATPDISRDKIYVTSEVLSSPVLRNQACQYCKTVRGGNKLCTGCRNAYYCSRNCQRRDWTTHKITCKTSAK